MYSDDIQQLSECVKKNVKKRRNELNKNTKKKQIKLINTKNINKQ